MDKNQHPNSFISIAKLRLREPIRNTRDVLKKLENNFTTDELNNAVDLCSNAIGVIGEIAQQDFAISQSQGFLQLIGELTHGVVNIARNPANVKKIGKPSVVEAIDKLVKVLNDIIVNVESYEVLPSCIDSCDAENLLMAFPLSFCVLRRKLSKAEIQAHAKLFIIKGDLYRYRSGLLSSTYDDAAKAYWTAFFFEHGNGIIFNQLGVIAASREHTDRLSTYFFFFRALYSATPFQNAKEILMSKLGAITEKMIQTEFAKHTEIFKTPSVADMNGIFASSVQNSISTEYYFPWFQQKQSAPNWRLQLRRLSPHVVIKIHNDIFFHVINLLSTKHSHPTLFQSCERFLLLSQYLIEEEHISGKQLLQITTIFILALKARDDTKAVVDENVLIVSRTFIFYIGLLYAKLSDIMDSLTKGKSQLLDVIGQVNTVIPSLVVIANWWSSISRLIPSDVYRSPSYNFDFCEIRKKIVKIGPMIQNYLKKFEASVKKTKIDDSSNNVYLLPEILLCFIGNCFTTEVHPLRLISTNSADTEIHKSFLIRLSIVQHLLAQMVSKHSFGLDSSFEHVKGCHNLSTFEIFALAHNKGAQVYAIYPEYIALDTNAIIDEYDKLMTMAQYGMKFIIPTVVWNELVSISRDRKKKESIRIAAKNASDLISKTISNRTNEFQIYNFYGERKFDLEFVARDIEGLNNKTKREQARDTNDDFIISICRNILDILGPNSRKGFHDPKISVRNVILLTDDRILRIKARSEEVLTCGFNDFYTWFQKCISSTSTSVK